MNASASEDQGQTSHIERLKGSELLLRKIPLYARAKGFADISLDDPVTESNSLSYDGSLYRVLSLLRAAHTECDEAEDLPSPRTGGSVEADGPFTGITAPFYSTLLRRGRWDQREDAVGKPADADRPYSLLHRLRIERARHEMELVESAVSLPLERELLRPTTGKIEALLLLGTASAQDAAAQADVEKQRQKRLRRAADPKRTKEIVDEAELPDKEDSDVEDETTSIREKEQLARLQRGVMLDAKRRRGYGANMALFATAPPGEACLVKAVRSAASTAAATALPGNGRADPGQNTLGARMMNVLLRRMSDAVGGAADEEGEKAVKAYLKRVAWLDRQSTAASLPSMALATTEPSWMQLSPADRVRREMAHTTRERQRFSRKRGRDEENGDGGAE